MKIAKFEHSDALRWGAITDGGAVDLTPLLGSSPDAVHALFDADGRARAEDYVAGRAPDASADELTFAPLLPAPEKIICVGVNYHNRNQEYRDEENARSRHDGEVRILHRASGDVQQLADNHERDRASDDVHRSHERSLDRLRELPRRRLP